MGATGVDEQLRAYTQALAAVSEAGAAHGQAVSAWRAVERVLPSRRASRRGTTRASAATSDGVGTGLPRLAGAERAHLALEHARRAQQADKGEPLYAFTEGQAFVLVGRWPEAARVLADLARYPLWTERAEREFNVLLQRRQQALSAALPPVTAARVEPARLSWFTREPEPVVKPPLKPRIAKPTWPPPRTVVLYGWLTAAECRGPEKNVTVKTPRFRVRLREPAGRQATLHTTPKKWRGLPCGTKGFWEVNVTY